MLSQSISWIDSFASLAVVFTLHLLVLLSIVPELVPAMPPVECEPVMAPEALLPEIKPVFSFTPAIPPTFVVPFTVPSKLQFVILPELLPAIPPTFSPLPLGVMVPLTFSSLTIAPRCTYLKSPA